MFVRINIHAFAHLLFESGQHSSSWVGLILLSFNVDIEVLIPQEVKNIKQLKNPNRSNKPITKTLQFNMQAASAGDNGWTYFLHF